ncbi:MAG: peptidylprolyl isomerase [Candidatus Ozemobacteraceae bacterium]
MNDYICVSRSSLLGTALGLALFTGLLMTFALRIDLETILSGSPPALKVGGTRIEMTEFSEMKKLAGSGAGALTDRAFAAELVETFLWAEEGRRRKLDDAPDFREQVRLFDLAISLNTASASLSTELSRSLFLAEELARHTRERIIEESIVEESSSSTSPQSPISSTRPQISSAPPSLVLATVPSALPEAHVSSLSEQVVSLGTPASFPMSEASRTISSQAMQNVKLPTKLHVRTILVTNEAAAAEIIAAAGSGISFGTLNQKYSQSPYAPVGGDMGSIGPEELPPGVFSSLVNGPIGSLSRLFTDEQGIHLYQLDELPGLSTASQEAQYARVQAVRKSAAVHQTTLDASLLRIRTEIPVFVHPSLRSSNP